MPDLSIASFNAHYGLRPYYSHRSRSPYDLHAALRTLDAEVIVIQEHWRPDGRRGPLDDAAEAIGLDVHHEPTGPATGRMRWPHLATDGEGTVGISVLTRLPVRRVAIFPLGPTPGDPAADRTALHVEIDVHGAPLQVVAIHLTSRLLHGPILQLRRLARAVPADARPAVIAGDCNFWGPGVRALVRGAWRRAVRGRTWPARHPHSQIDHILTRNIQVKSGQVLQDIGSDHRPIRAELTW